MFLPIIFPTPCLLTVIIMSYLAEFLMGTLKPLIMWIMILASLQESKATAYRFCTTGRSFLPVMNILLNRATRGFSDSSSSNSDTTDLYWVVAFWCPAFISLWYYLSLSKKICLRLMHSASYLIAFSSFSTMKTFCCCSCIFCESWNLSSSAFLFRYSL